MNFWEKGKENCYRCLNNPHLTAKNIINNVKIPGLNVRGLLNKFPEYRSSKVSLCPDCIFEIHHLWLSGLSTVYSNSCSSYSFEPEIIKIGKSSHKMYINNILNFQESTTISNACTKISGNLLKASHMMKTSTESSSLSSKEVSDHSQGDIWWRHQPNLRVCHPRKTLLNI